MQRDPLQVIVGLLPQARDLDMLADMAARLQPPPEAGYKPKIPLPNKMSSMSGMTQPSGAMSPQMPSNLMPMIPPGAAPNQSLGAMIRGS